VFIGLQCATEFGKLKILLLVQRKFHIIV